MSKIIPNKDLHRINVIYGEDEVIGYFSFLACPNHYDTLCFTDKSGADTCLKCVEEQFTQDGYLIKDTIYDKSN